jgi:hypothetical protein
VWSTRRAPTTDESRGGTTMRRRFVAPMRGSIDSRCFDAPLFDGFRAYSRWFVDAQWPSIDALDAALSGRVHPASSQLLHFVEQTPQLLDDGLHYEQRIFERGAIATRAGNWHDLFNAIIWIEHTVLKAALNVRQAADVACNGATQRTRAQCAMTQFDEAGAVLLLRDDRLLEAWNAHDWIELFWRQRDAWHDGRAQVLVFGHALLEHALQPAPVHTAKCAAVMCDGVLASDATLALARDRVASAVLAGSSMNDPQELRPLPLSGIPGWHPDNANASFYALAPCFRPLRDGRIYPAPLRF